MNLTNSIDEIDPERNYSHFSDDFHSCCYYSLNDFEKLSIENDFSVINYNIRSFNTNFEYFSSAFTSKSFPSVLTLTETWTSHEFPSSYYDIPGYIAFHTIRDGRSGDVSVYVKNNLKSTCVENFSFVNSCIEICTVEVIFFLIHMLLLRFIVRTLVL